MFFGFEGINVCGREENVVNSKVGAWGMVEWAYGGKETLGIYGGQKLVMYCFLHKLYQRVEYCIGRILMIRGKVAESLLMA